MPPTFLSKFIKISLENDEKIRVDNKRTGYMHDIFSIICIICNIQYKIRIEKEYNIFK